MYRPFRVAGRSRRTRLDRKRRRAMRAVIGRWRLKQSRGIPRTSPPGDLSTGGTFEQARFRVTDTRLVRDAFPAAAFLIAAVAWMNVAAESTFSE